MPRSEIAGVICRVPGLRITHVIRAGEQKQRERDCVVLGELHGRRQPQALQRALEKHPCRSGCSPRPAAVCLGICHQFPQEPRGRRGLIARFLRKRCHKCREGVRRGRGVGRALQEKESGNPPPTSPGARLGPSPSGLFRQRLEIAFGFRLNPGKAWAGLLSQPDVFSQESKSHEKSLINDCNSGVSERLPLVDQSVLGDFTT